MVLQLNVYTEQLGHPVNPSDCFEKRPMFAIPCARVGVDRPEGNDDEDNLERITVRTRTMDWHGPNERCCH